MSVMNLCGIRAILIIFILSFSGLQKVLATDDEKMIHDTKPELNTEIDLSNSEFYARTQAVLKYYQTPAEIDPSNEFDDLKNQTTLLSLQKKLKWMDPLHFFSRVSQFLNNELSVFQDLDEHRILDFSVPLKVQTAETEPVVIDQPAEPAALALAGLRIAIDPGHMGGDFWDRETGKFVRDQSGHIVSEGLIALQTSLILKKQLEELGAEVLLTRELLQPVSTLDYKNFDMRPLALKELIENQQANWFQNMIQKYSIGPDLFHHFDASSQVKSLFSSLQKSSYFILREDLMARVKMINQFNPDLVLIIHFDTANSGQSVGLNPNAPLDTKAFVFGSYEANEFGSRESRKYFSRHLLDDKASEESIRLSRALVQNLQKKLHLNLSESTAEGTQLIEPGVIARNLFIPRMVKAKAVSYLECFFYNQTEMFQALLQTKYPMTIGGVSSPYSETVLQTASAIKEGVLQYKSSSH